MTENLLKIKKAQTEAHKLNDPELFEQVLQDLLTLSAEEAEDLHGAKLVRIDCYRMLERWAEMVAYSGELIASGRNEEPLVYLGLATGLWKQGKGEKAKQVLEKALGRWPLDHNLQGLLETIEGADCSLDTESRSRKIVYVDMDGVMCDYSGSYFEALRLRLEIEYPQSVPGFFSDLPPIDGAIKAVNKLRKHSDLYVLTAPSTRNPACYSEKRIWIEKHFGYQFTKKLIICPNKFLLIGDYLIDDHVSGKEQEGFKGQLIQFGSCRYADWNTVVEYLLEKIL
ncbi:5' nucleotidase, NT5C type [Pelagicoccus mobilis]|uniref:Uncharacterized protein n=1 Tax=Pelagicoccus mobilis TaxID=415221 RepID=A0A934RSL0_9BACT|nr:hypothetical protein [Pelagicoccus mobilis]MBK1875606.1 hypothetical protein [Pelagicoccus mobilis]